MDVAVTSQPKNKVAPIDHRQVFDQEVQQTPPHGQVQHTPPPAQVDGLQSGFECLSLVDKISFRSKVYQTSFGFLFDNRNFSVQNSAGEQILNAYDESNHNGNCLMPWNHFRIRITDNNDHEVLDITRENKTCGCCPCFADGLCPYIIFVKDKDGKTLGTARAMFYLCVPKFGVFDNNDQQLYEITGPCAYPQGPCCSSVEHPVRNSKDGSYIGEVKIYWPQSRPANNLIAYEVKFPMEMDTDHKALLIGAVFLVDTYIFEYKRGRGIYP